MSPIESRPTSQVMSLPRDGIAFVFVSVVYLEPHDSIGPRTTLYGRGPGVSRITTHERQPGDGNHLGYKPTTDRVA